MSALEYDFNVDIEVIYPKKQISENNLITIIEKIIDSKVSLKNNTKDISGNNDFMFNNYNNEDEEDTELSYSNVIGEGTHIIDLLLNDVYNREEKINELNKILNYSGLPKVKGDEVTFIGSTFIKNVKVNHT